MRLLPAALCAAAALAVPAFGSDASPRAATHAAPRGVLPFIADDYARAVAEARARRVPLFVEAWAPW